MQGIFRFLTGFIFIFYAMGAFAAQNFFTNTNTPDTRGTPPAPAVVRNPVMTPDQFKAGINRINDQTQKNISEQLNKQLIKPQAPQPTPPAEPPAADNTNNYSIENEPAATQKAQPQPGSIQPLPAQQGQAMPVPQTATPVQGSVPQQSAPSNSTYYPSFGTGTNKPGSPSPAPAANPSGGNQGQGSWNIKY
jgi:hypothetical protein